MSLKKVVIATKKAVEGTWLKPWVHYIPAEKPIDFAYKIIETLSRLNDYEQTIANNGFSYVTDHHSVDVIVGNFLKVLKGA
jgi:hypothetical protein